MTGPQPPSLQIERQEADAQAPVRVRLEGDWSAAALARSGRLEALARAQAAAGPSAAWDLSGAARLDHLGAQWLWDAWGRRWPERLEATPAQRAMLERVARWSTLPPPPASGWLPGVRRQFLRLGAGLFLVADHLRDLLALVGQLALDLLALLRAPRMGPWRDVSGHLYRIGATALPITALVGFLIGVVLAYLTSQQLKLFGAETFIVNILGLSLIRELGPVLAAVLIAGRSGSTITAQIGVMRITEEIDAMRVMGIARGFRLVMPRVIALAVAMPLLTLWTTIAALIGGMLAAEVALGLSPAYFISNLPRAVQASNLGLAMGKSLVFGVLIALVGCHYGLRVKPNTESLGAGTTASVVTSITVVILVDALFAVLFKNVGI
ncbi:phospholipid/cholesterol/gamma-HCH transport system permease protein [Tibeticola sediminis]|uniref:Phospholipid/cholesterol/gamma-HCH transport system permease protein n=1 Tax=Tibeticola sediminis TaxID=1917811 RepID=A0A3N4UPY1_9BURK|nr:ABC transporter permease [Tibeticola sediminis]RPE72403.1 phospholipid/cholesterol/gamma-HCH transport system permease protein [Tibeticola sediminis]